MASPKDYVVYVLGGERSQPGGPARKSTGVDRAKHESGADQKRQNLPAFLYTGIWWYALFPNHYSGDGSVAGKEPGEWNVQGWFSTIRGHSRRERG